MACHQPSMRRSLFAALFTLAVFRHFVSAWNYEEHGADWTQFGVCNGLGSHTAQSPIDMPIRALEDTATNLYLKYPKLSSSVQLYNNEKSMAMTMPESYTAGFGVGENFGVLSNDNADVYRLWQVHFHSPAEHTLNGIRYPLEMQMMHQRVSGDADLAVVVVLFEAVPDATNNFLDVVLGEGLPQNAWDEVTINNNVEGGGEDATITNLELNFGAVAGGSGYFTYEGSLTVPPCETGVKYYIRQQPIAADPAAHIEPFSSALSNLCPPNGNYRAIGAASSAYASIRMISSIDVILSPDDKAQPRPLQANPAAVNAALDAYYRSVLQNAEDINVMSVGDSTALRDAKESYHRAMMNTEAARMAKLSAEMKLNEASTNYNNAKGYVEQIDFKWKLIAANDAMSAASTGLGSAEDNLAVVIRNSGALYIRETGLSPTPTYGASAGAKATTESDPDLVLQYSPLVSLPRGPDASPFSPNADSVAESAVRVGSGVAGSGTPLQNGMKIAPNLRQPDGAAGQVPIPSLVRRTTTTAAPTTTPPPMQVSLKLPIQYNSIADMPALQSELAATVAVSMGIDASRVEVAEVRPTVMYPSADGTGSRAAPPPAGAASSPAAAAASPAAAVFMEWRSAARGAQRRKRERRHEPGLLRRLMR